MPVRRNLDYGLKVSIASDVAGSHESAMNRHIVMAIEASKAKTFETGYTEDKPLRLPEAFYMATKVGGSFFGEVGSFEPGYPWKNVLSALSTPVMIEILKSGM